MSKREWPNEDDERPPKRARPDQQHQQHQPVKTEEIHYARQLQDLLVFRQDGIQQLRNGIASFKVFLESILYHKEEDNRSRQISILREYLESQKPSDLKDLERPFLSQLWQAWSFASQNNNDYLVSSVSAILALLLRTLSAILDLREPGLLLCRTVLQQQHLRLVKRGLDAPKHRDFVISPALRLLTEVVGFDGGVLARELYKRREQSFDISTLRRCLGLVKVDISEDEARRKPAVRTLAVRYILSLLRHLHEGGQVDVLKNRPLCSVLFQHLRDDPSDLVNDLLATLEMSVLNDPELPRSSKAALLTVQNLEKVTEIATRVDEGHASSEKAFAWLSSVCKKQDYGILRASGWYPPETTKHEVKALDGTIDLGLDSIEFYDRSDSLSVRNPVLLNWAHTLRPQTSERERDLLLLCFESAPELIAAYFSEKTLQLDPKLTNTWIGYASLLFEIITLPVPKDFGCEDDDLGIPPQSSIVIESILPRPLTRAILTRCLNQNSELISFFAIRILVVAFQKLASVLTKMRNIASKSSGHLWKEAEERIVRRFVDRCPLLKDVITTFRKLPNDEEHVLQREATARLLRLFYEVTPLQALSEQFDTSTALTVALVRSQSQSEDSESQVRGLRSLELEHLLAVAQHSAGMKWFTKQGGLQFSPVVTLIRLHRQAPDNRQIRRLLAVVLAEQGILNAGIGSAKPAPIEALVASVAQLPDESHVWVFLDDCVSRANRRPVVYVDDLEALVKSTKVDKPNNPSILAAVVLEQAPFVAGNQDEASLDQAAWIDLFLALLKKTSDGGSVLDALAKVISALPGWNKTKAKSKLVNELLQLTAHEESQVHTDAKDEVETESSARSPALPFQAPPQETDNHPELTRWSQKDIDLAVEEGTIDALILCLCSKHNDVRRQGIVQLNKLKLQLRSNTSHENAQQLALLVGEVAETFEQQYLRDDRSLPYLAGTFSARALHVQMQPQNFMYPKVNKFLIRGPEWRVSKLPKYWLSNTVLGLPEVDDAYWREAQWVLDWLVDGLRTQGDLEILRRGGIFEKTMTLWSSPGSASHKAARERVFELLYRATCIEGGSDMLVTRTGVLTWLETIQPADGNLHVALRQRITDSCDAERLQSWKGTKPVSVDQ